MTVGIYKVKESWLGEHWYATKLEKEDLTSRGRMFFMEYIDIPERFQPRETPEGGIVVNCDGTGYMLREVLGVAKDGGPALVWEDPKYGYLHTVRLEEVYMVRLEEEH